MAEIKMPPFTRGKKELDNVYVDWNISVVSINVESHWYFEAELHYISASKKVSVCCALIRLCPGVSQD